MIVLPQPPSRDYRNAQPFPHAVFDNFLPADYAAEVARSLSRDQAGWKTDAHAHQRGKTWIEDQRQLPSPARDVLLWFNSGTVLHWMQQLTGIPDLIPDMEFMGGGVHRMASGGHLGLHCDFNFHPTLYLHRRVNALLFLNPDWQPEWGGNLELWPADLSAYGRSIAPVLNRLAVFTITDKAFHGVPTPLMCPPGRQRLSLALYYYTVDRPDAEKGPAHLALWQEMK